MAVQTCGGVWPSHGIFTYNSIKEVCVFWKIVMLSNARKYLPSVYLSLPEVLPRGLNGRIVSNMQRIIQNTGSFSGLTLELKNIINNPKWHTALIELGSHTLEIEETIKTIRKTRLDHNCLLFLT